MNDSHSIAERQCHLSGRWQRGKSPHDEDQGVFRGEGVNAVGFPLPKRLPRTVAPAEGHLLGRNLLPGGLPRLQVNPQRPPHRPPSGGSSLPTIPAREPGVPLEATRPRRVKASIPLRGSIPCNPVVNDDREIKGLMSQSPYGAQSLATRPSSPALTADLSGRNPLTGLNPLQPLEKALEKVSPTLVSQSPYGAQSLATGPPKEPRPGRRRQRGGL